VTSIPFIEIPGWGALIVGAVVFIYATRQAGNSLSYCIGLTLGAIGLLVFVVALGRSLWPIIHNLPPDQPYLVPQGPIFMALGLVYMIFALGICSDMVTVVLTRRELAAFFYSPIAYLVILGLVLIGGIMFISFVDQLTESPMMEPIVSRYLIHFIPVI